MTTQVTALPAVQVSRGQARRALEALGFALAFLIAAADVLGLSSADPVTSAISAVFLSGFLVSAAVLVLLPANRIAYGPAVFGGLAGAYLFALVSGAAPMVVVIAASIALCSAIPSIALFVRGRLA